jgi:hypothetical protein
MNEGVKAIAGLASRYANGRSGLTNAECRRRAARLANAFAAAYNAKQLGVNLHIQSADVLSSADWMTGGAGGRCSCAPMALSVCLKVIAKHFRMPPIGEAGHGGACRVVDAPRRPGSRA